MADNKNKLIGQLYTTPDLVAKVTGKARYAEDYRAEHEQGPDPLGGGASGVPLGRSFFVGRCGLELRCHARAMVDGGSATTATRGPAPRRVTLWSSAASPGRPPTPARYCRDRCR